jgi:large subunit ribosomal protein L13
MKTYATKPEDIERRWYVVDAEGKILGRLASEVARILRGKHKPYFAPHLDTGDYVIVINAAKIRVTGKKLDDKIYYRHSGYPGGLRSTTLAEMLKKRPTRVIRLAVRGMLPHNRLGRAMIKKLKIYEGESHPHQAQNPQPLEL